MVLTSWLCSGTVDDEVSGAPMAELNLEMLE